MSDSPTLPVVIAEVIAVRANINLGENDVFQFEAYCDKSAPQAELDELCDRIAKAGARRRAKHLLPTYRRNLEDIDHKTGENKQRKAELAARLEVSDELRQSKILELRQRSGRISGDAEAAHIASGKRGDWKPEGHTKGELSRVEGDIRAIEENGLKEVNEAQIQFATLDNEIKEGERMAFKWTQLIDELEAQAAGRDE